MFPTTVTTTTTTTTRNATTTVPTSAKDANGKWLPLPAGWTASANDDAQYEQEARDREEAGLDGVGCLYH
jgi:hypothetical protein